MTNAKKLLIALGGVAVAAAVAAPFVWKMERPRAALEKALGKDSTPAAQTAPPTHWEAAYDPGKACGANWFGDMNIRAPQLTLNFNIPEKPENLRLLVAFYNDVMTVRVNNPVLTIKTAAGSFRKPLEFVSPQAGNHFLYYLRPTQAEMSGLIKILENAPGDIEVSLSQFSYRGPNTGAKAVLEKFSACAKENGGVSF